MTTSLSGLDGASFDLVVIGLGPAGEKGAAQAAYFGKRVAGIEAAAVGGAVVNTGTLPSKTLRETALYLSGLRSRSLYGIDYTFGRRISVADLFYRQKLIERSHLDLVEQNLDRHHITLLHGHAAFEDPRTVLVRGHDGKVARIQGEYILIAAGSRPVRPPQVPFDDERVYDTDSVLRLKQIPRDLVIIGAGVIGSEYATLFAALGSHVTLVDGGARLLPFLDSEISAVLAAQMREVGVHLLQERHMQSIDPHGGEPAVTVTLTDGTVLQTDAVLYGGGRRGNTDSLALENAGITADERGRIAVDEHFRTSAPGVFAAGDVVGFPALASTSMEQARVAVCQAFGFDYKRQVSSLIPYGLYTIPEVSMVGASEDSLRAAGTPYLVGRGTFGNNARAQIAGDTTGLIKLLFDPETRRLLGVHIVGERATELVHVGQMCMQFGGSIDVFIENVFNFPTIADAYKYAAYDGLQALARYQAAHAGRDPATAGDGREAGAAISAP
jgi:NAD(P) transhydrogenase